MSPLSASHRTLNAGAALALFLALGLARGCSEKTTSSTPFTPAGSAGSDLDAGDETDLEAAVDLDAESEDEAGDAYDEGDGEAGPCVPGDAAIPSPPQVDVPAGEFWMGCNEAVDSSCDPAEKPYHKVLLSGFRIDKHEVTVSEYQACLQACVCTFPKEEFDPAGHPEHPVVGVTLTQAGTYCTWIGRRLPTEAEWEKAARGSEGRIYPWGDTAPECSQAAFLGCAFDGQTASTFPVGTFSPAGDSPYGAQDMAGNVWEWVSDWYGPYDANNPPDPEGPQTGILHLWRGGGYLHSAEFLRTSKRYPYAKDSYRGLGIRCVQSL